MSAPMPMPMSAPMSDQDPVAPADATNAFLPSSAAPVAPVAPAAASIGPRTVTDLLAGIKLPNDLAPITMMAPRPDVGDRIAFVTEGVPGATVGAAFGAELERLGYTLTPLNPTLIAADRGTDQLRCMIHLDAAAAEIGKAKAFPAVPVGAVVIEVWSLF
jgi:hypothetical protein